jgi:membrane protein YqaA with SNARE-associated domain
MPLGIDALVIYMTARHTSYFWIYPLIAVAGSIAGAGLTYWVGLKVGQKGLARLIPERPLRRIKRQLKKEGALMALPAALPPPLPVSPFILACGAFEVSLPRVFLVFTAARVFRFGIEGLLARIYGRRVLDMLKSETLQHAIIALIALAILATGLSAILLWRRARHD